MNVSRSLIGLIAVAALLAGALLTPRAARADFFDGGGFSWGSYWAVVPPPCAYSAVLDTIVCTAP